MGKGSNHVRMHTAIHNKIINSPLWHVNGQMDNN